MSDGSGDDLTPSDQGRPTQMTGGEIGSVELVDVVGVAELPVVMVDGEPMIMFSRAMETLGLNAEAQLRSLNRREWADIVFRPVAAEPGAPRRRTALVTVAVFTGHCMTVLSSTVAPRRREALRAFQRESVGALADYWTRGIAVNPRGLSDAEVALLRNGPAVLRALGELQRGHYYDQMTVPQSAGIGRRDLEPGLTESQARQRALAAYRKGYRLLAHPALELSRELPETD